MKPFTLLFLFAIVALSCNQTIDKATLPLLNGYWEITKVEFAGGGNKEYKMNSNIDFFKLDGLKGYRKKVNPKFDGSYETSDDAELFTVKVTDSASFIVYENDLSKWQETIESLKSDTFSVKNSEGTVYHYKRFEPINMTP